MTNPENTFKKMGAASIPYENEAAKEQELQYLREKNRRLHASNLRLWFELHKVQEQAEITFDYLSFLADSLEKGSDRKLARRMLAAVQRQKYWHHPEGMPYLEQFDHLYLPEESSFPQQLPKRRGGFHDVDYY